MKTILVTAALSAFALGGCAQSEGNNNHDTNEQGTTSERNALPAQDDYLRTHSARMITDLKLTDDQSSRLNKLNSTHYEEQMNLRQSHSDRENWREMDEAASENYEKKLRGVLNDVQFEQYEANRQNYIFDYSHGNSNTVAPTNKPGTSSPGSGQGTSTQPNGR